MPPVTEGAGVDHAALGASLRPVQQQAQGKRWFPRRPEGDSLHRLDTQRPRGIVNVPCLVIRIESAAQPMLGQRNRNILETGRRPAPLGHVRQRLIIQDGERHLPVVKASARRGQVGPITELSRRGRRKADVQRHAG